MFRLMFSSSEIVTGSERSDSFPAEYRELYKTVAPDPNWKIGFAHEGVQMIESFQGNYSLITILREPRDLLRSAFKVPVFEQCKEINQTMTMVEWLDNDISTPCVNSLTLGLCNNGSHYPFKEELWDRFGPLPDALAESKERLRQMTWFGLTHRWTESICLLYYSFGWKPLSNMDWKAARVRHDTLPLTDEEDEAIRRVAWADLELFKYAEEIFDGRIEQMKYEVLNQEYATGRIVPEVWHLDCLRLIYGENLSDSLIPIEPPQQ